MTTQTNTTDEQGDAYGKAAEDLVKAVQSEVNNAPQVKMASILASIKYTLESKLDAGITNQSEVSASLKGLNSKLDKVQTSLVEVVNTQTAIQAEMEQQIKLTRLQWAIDHVDYGSFVYCNGQNNSRMHSKDIAKTILYWFMKGYGYYVGNDSMLSYCSIETEREKSRQQFRNKLSDQIHFLTGVKPKVQLDAKDGRYLFSYS